MGSWQTFSGIEQINAAGYLPPTIFALSLRFEQTFQKKVIFGTLVLDHGKYVFHRG